MPHAFIEYSHTIQSLISREAITDFVHGTMIDSGLFTPADIKTRLYPAMDFRVGEKGAAGSFLHVTLALLEGRTAEQKQSLSESLRDGLAKRLSTVDQISVEIRDIAKGSYRKHVAA